MENTRNERVDLGGHLEDAIQALRYVAGQKGEVRVKLLLDDPNIDAFGPFDEQLTVGVEHTKLGCVGLLSVGKRQCGAVDLTVAGVAVDPILDAEFAPESPPQQ